MRSQKKLDMLLVIKATIWQVKKKQAKLETPICFFASCATTTFKDKMEIRVVP